MPLNERDVTAATAAEVRRAGPITPRALRRAVAARLGLDARDEAVLIENYAQCIEDAAAAAAASGSDDASYDAVAGEEKFDAIAIEASAAPFEDDSFASARPVDEPEVVELLAALSSGNTDTPARKRETRPARIPSSSADEATCYSRKCTGVAKRSYSDACGGGSAALLHADGAGRGRQPAGPAAERSAVGAAQRVPDAVVGRWGASV